MKIRSIAFGVVVLVLLGQCSSAGDDTSDRDETPEPRAVTQPTPTPDVTTSSTTPAAPDTTTPTAGPDDDGALAALVLLPMKGRAPMTGYDRNRYGSAWLDADRNGCDTRNDLLVTYLVDADKEDNDCVVASGTYEDPYTGRTIAFRQGEGDLIDIDHVVAMGNSWVTGAFAWHIKKRAAFANDPLNLLPADAGANRQKGDGDAATWLPPYKPFRCSYVARQITVKRKYGLWVTAPERAAFERVLADCPGEPLVEDTWQAPTRVDHDIVDPGARPTRAPAPPSVPTKPAPVPLVSVYYENCDAARAAGAAPVRVGNAGYGSHLDRDGDGVGCE